MPRALVFLLAALAGACTAQPVVEEPAARIVSYSEIALRTAHSRARANDLKGADESVRAALEHPSFNDLTPELQHWGLLIAGLIANDLREHARALELLRRSSAMPQAGVDDWHGRYSAGFGLEDHLEATTSLTRLARRWPERLSHLNDSAIVRTLSRSSADPAVSADQRLELLQAMFDLKWRLQLGQNPDWAWRDLALMLLARGSVDRAVEAARQVENPSTLISMRIDRRFDALASRVPLDPRAAMKPALERARAAAAAHPRSLKALVALTYVLLDARDFAEVLRITEPFTPEVSPMSALALGFDDWSNQATWMVDNRARAFDATGRWDEAAALFKRASARSESGDVNVSQAINLGYLLCRMGRPDEALQAVAVIGEVSPYGRMQLESVRLLAAVQRNDAAARDEALNYLRAHERDAIDTLQEVLVHANLLDEAAALLRRRLADETLRSSALGQVQRYFVPALTPWMRGYHERRNQLLARPDVIDAITKVGRLERFDYYHSMEY